MTQGDHLQLQQAIYAEGHRWRAGPTSLSALPPEEQKARLGLLLDTKQIARIATAMIIESALPSEYPQVWDWRARDGDDWTTPIRDQQACGACVAFAVVAVLESMIKRYYGDSTLQPELSEAHLFFCGCGDCCSKGWWPSYALNYAKNQGVPDEACFPYDDRNLPCTDSCAEWPSHAIKATEWREVTDVGARKEWLSTRGPMVGCMAVYQDFFSYTGGVYRHTVGSLSGYHAVGVIGYSELEQVWICKNSWGTNWGDGGWFKIGYGQCGMDTQFAMYGIEDIVPPSDGPPPPPPPPAPVPGCNLWARATAAAQRLRAGIAQ